MLECFRVLDRLKTAQERFQPFFRLPDAPRALQELSKRPSAGVTRRSYNPKPFYIDFELQNGSQNGVKMEIRSTFFRVRCPGGVQEPPKERPGPISTSFLMDLT